MPEIGSPGEVRRIFATLSKDSDFIVGSRQAPPWI